MKTPTLLDYQRAVQNPSHAFSGDPVLHGGKPVRNPQGMPSVASGGFAATFRIAVSSNRHYAVRCFHKHAHLDHNLLERYRHIGEFVSAHRDLSFLVDVAYQPNGIKVDGIGYPTVRMPWAAGEPLGFWVEDWAEDPGRDPDEMEKVRRGIAAAVEQLGLHGAAHGDLQHGNILVLPDLSVRLIDYDGIYLDSFRTLPHLRALEEGHRNYQHPGRGAHFDSTLDVFSAEVIDLSLRALRDRPELWETYGGTGENLLFEARDFVDPAHSDVFDALASIPDLTDQVHRLRLACQVDFPDVPTALAGHSVARTAAGSFSLAVDDVFAAEEKEELRCRQGETVTVFGTVEFASVTIGKGGHDVALINLGDYTRGDFTIVGYEDVADTLFGVHGVTTRREKRILPGLVGWRVAVTGTLVLYEYKYKGEIILVPQIELGRAGRLRNLTQAQFDALKSKAAQRRKAMAARPSVEPALPSEATTTQAPPPEPSTRPASVPRRADAALQAASTREADRYARLHELYKNYAPSAPPPSEPTAPPPQQYSAPATPPPQPRPIPVPPPPPPVPPPQLESSTIAHPFVGNPQHGAIQQPPSPLKSSYRLHLAVWILLPVALLVIVALIER